MTNKGLEQYIEKQLNLDTLRFLTCGSVDDGKSTMVGRMYYESGQIFKDELESLRRLSKAESSSDNELDFSLLLDGLSFERNQGITIDVAYRYFTTDKRRFIVADSPGHEQYTRNMATAASNSELAIILVDASKGLLNQTKRHSIICSELGVRHALLVVNKIDIVDYSEEVFTLISEAYRKFAKQLRFESLEIIPLSARFGDNVRTRSSNLDWFQGKSLLPYLETVDTSKKRKGIGARSTVQWIGKTSEGTRFYSGTVEGGNIGVGEECALLPSGERATVKTIFRSMKQVEIAETGQAVSIVLDKHVDVAIGDVVTTAGSTVQVADHFLSRIIWLSRDPGFASREYWIRLGSAEYTALITRIKNKIDIHTLEKHSAEYLALNELYVVNIELEKQIAWDSYANCRSLGSFILIDKTNNQTVAAGMIDLSLHRSENRHLQALDVDRESRNNLNGHKNKVVWLTGISGSGKSTIANALERRLHSRGFRTFILDGDNIRLGLNRDLGFTDQDRVENMRRVAEVAKLMLDAGIVVICALISPFKAEREAARALFDEGDFIEVFVSTPKSIAEQRDPKGLYKKAREGNIRNFTSISSRYETPENPDLEISTDKEDLERSVNRIIRKLNLE